MDFRPFMCLILQAWLHKGWFPLCWHEKASQGGVRVYHLTWLIHSSLYAHWLTKGNVPHWVCMFRVEKYWLRHTGCDHSPKSFSQRTLLCGRWEDIDTMIMASFAKTRPLEPIIFQYVIHSKNKVYFNASGRKALRLSGVAWYSIHINRHLGSGRRSTEILYLSKSTDTAT